MVVLTGIEPASDRVRARLHYRSAIEPLFFVFIRAAITAHAFIRHF